MKYLQNSRGWIALFVCCGLLPLNASCQGSSQAAPAPCSQEEHRAFDFWVGDWVVTNLDGAELGRNTIELTEGGCLLVENWTSAQGGTGKSMNYWDPAEKLWKQVWVSTNGSVGHFNGGLMREGVMVLEGDMLSADGSALLLKGTWTLQNDGRVRQLFEQSTDKGATWSTWFDGYYAKSDSSAQ